MKKKSAQVFIHSVLLCLGIVLAADIILLVTSALEGDLFETIGELCVMTGCLVGINAVVKVMNSIQKTVRSYRDFINGKTPDIQSDITEMPLSPEYQVLIMRLNEALGQEARLELTKRQAEYLALQNQINPHFLYNTLEAMRGDALAAGMDSLAGTAEALSSFFRYTISDTDTLSTVEREIRNIENYFQIQHYRFGDNLKLEIHLLEDDQEIPRLRIPKLTLQPIVENAVFHGLETQVNKGRIDISFDQSESCLFISVKDSGIGIEEEKLKQLNQSLNEAPFSGTLGRADDQENKLPQSRHTGIALKNVSQRIKLLFGEEYGLHIYSTLNVGTTVEVVLPRRFK